jgi:hypothetical protein
MELLGEYFIDGIQMHFCKKIQYLDETSIENCFQKCRPVLQVGLDWAKVLLLWSLVDSVAMKFFLTVRILYALYALALGALCMAVGALNRRTLTHLLMLATAVIVTVLCVVPTATPLVQSWFKFKTDQTLLPLLREEK